MRYYIDSDNGLGSPFGDVDDAFAIAALLRSGLDVMALGSVSGNTTEPRAAANNMRLAELCRFQGPLVRPQKRGISRLLASEEDRMTIAALGPLTNIAAALQEDATLPSRVTEVVVVGSNISSRGGWPPLWPHEFNLTRDKAATFAVFNSALPLTFVPLDVARRLRATRSRLRAIQHSVIGSHLGEGSRRWMRRARILKWSSSFPIWDLTAAMYLIEPALYVFEDTFAEMASSTHVRFGTGSRPVRLVRSFDAPAVWEAFTSLIV